MPHWFSKGKHEFMPEDDQFGSGGIDTQMTTLPKHGGWQKPQVAKGDSSLKLVIEDTRFMGKRAWAAPNLKDAFDCIGGAGATLTAFVQKAVGEKKRLKEEIPMSPERWTKWTTALVTEDALESIPILGQIATPFASIIASRSEGKGWGNSFRDAGANTLGSLVDGALGALTLGAYTTYSVAAKYVHACATVVMTAHYYADTYQDTITHIERMVRKLNNEWKWHSHLMVSSKMEEYYKRYTKWMEQQKKHCADRGPKYHKIKSVWERKLADAVRRLKKVVEKLKKMKGKGNQDEDMLVDFLNMN